MVLIRALVWSSLFVGFVLLYIPSRLIPEFGLNRAGTTLFELAGLVIGSFGAAFVVWSIATFVAVGRGTPAPFDPPRRLVVRGPYRFVRNPMYIGACLVLFGAAVVYGSWILGGYAGFLFVVTHLFVVYYEEPTLKSMFGTDYVAYRDVVRRWIPVIRTRAAVASPTSSNDV